MGRESAGGAAAGSRKRRTLNVERRTSNGRAWESVRYSTDYGNADSNFSLGELTPKHFSFNSHFGACPSCHGLGTEQVVDPDLMISDPTKSIAEGAIVPWRRGTKRMQAYYKILQTALVKHFGVDEFLPFTDLPDKFQNGADPWHGRPADPDELRRERQERESGQAVRRA